MLSWRSNLVLDDPHRGFLPRHLGARAHFGLHLWILCDCVLVVITMSQAVVIIGPSLHGDGRRPSRRSSARRIPIALAERRQGQRLLGSKFPRTTDCLMSLDRAWSPNFAKYRTSGDGHVSSLSARSHNTKMRRDPGARSCSTQRRGLGPNLFGDLHRHSAAI